MHAIVLLMLAATAVLAGCAPAAEATPTPPPNATPDAISAAATLSAYTAGPKAGQPATDFTLKAIDGSDVTLSALQGKGVLLVFWATWCGYCRDQFPALASVYEEAREDGLEMLAINEEEEPERVIAYVAEHELPFPVLMDRKGEVADRYRVRGLPTLVFIDPEGVVQRVHPGTMEASDLQANVDALLPPKS